MSHREETVQPDSVRSDVHEKAIHIGKQAIWRSPALMSTDKLTGHSKFFRPQNMKIKRALLRALVGANLVARDG